MSVNYMYGQKAGDKISDRECPLCQRTVNDGRGGGWCFSCFEQWYDGDLSHENGDNLNPVKIANHVRRKNKLPRLTDEQIQRIVDYQKRPVKEPADRDHIAAPQIPSQD